MRMRLFATVLEYTKSGDGDESEPERTTDENVITIKKRKTSHDIFSCPEEGCSRSFRNVTSLDQHLMIGNCDIKEEKLSLSDRSKVIYAHKLKEGSIGVSVTKKPLLHTEANRKNTSLKQGWALKVKKTKTVFTDDQKEYMKEKFMLGKSTGRKEDPSKVADMMRTVKVNGEKRFRKEHFLTTQPNRLQVIFQDLRKKDRIIDEYDIVAATADSKSSILKQDVLNECAF